MVTVLCATIPPLSPLYIGFPQKCVAFLWDYRKGGKNRGAAHPLYIGFPQKCVEFLWAYRKGGKNRGAAHPLYTGLPQKCAAFLWDYRKGGKSRARGSPPLHRVPAKMCRIFVGLSVRCPRRTAQRLIGQAPEENGIAAYRAGVRGGKQA